MSVVDDLVKVIATRAQNKAVAEAEQKQREAAECLERFVKAFGRPLMDELHAEAGYHERRGIVWLTYRGVKKAWGDLAGYADPPCATLEDLAEWFVRVDREHAKFENDRQEQRERIIYLVESNFTLDRDHLAVIDKYALRDFEDVCMALEWHAARILVAAEDEKHKRRAEIKADLAAFWRAICDARQATTFEQLGRIREWKDRHHCADYKRARVLRDRLMDELEAARVRLENEEAEREKRRAQAEQEAFRPFVFYRVHYGVVAHDGGEMFVETECFDALHKATSGVWVPVGKPQVELAHLVKVEHIAVLNTNDLPGWCPKRLTEWGKISVAPYGAEFLD